MTIKVKLIGGFSILIVFMLILAFMGLSKLGDTQTRLRTIVDVSSTGGLPRHRILEIAGDVERRTVVLQERDRAARGRATHRGRIGNAKSRDPTHTTLQTVNDLRKVNRRLGGTYRRRHKNPDETRSNVFHLNLFYTFY